MIEAYGGAEKFYSDYFISSASPLGFTKDGKNLNYYDIRELQLALENVHHYFLRKQIGFGISTDVAFCLGEGDNFKTWTSEQKRNYLKK